MYKLFTNSSRTEKRVNEYISFRDDIKNRLDRLKENPYRNNGAHKLKGKLSGKYACWLGSNIRVVYKIYEEEKTILVESIGTHKVY